jgi:hypothetical protein
MAKCTSLLQADAILPEELVIGGLFGCYCHQALLQPMGSPDACCWVAQSPACALWGLTYRRASRVMHTLNVDAMCLSCVGLTCQHVLRQLLRNVCSTDMWLHITWGISLVHWWRCSRLHLFVVCCIHAFSKELVQPT